MGNKISKHRMNELVYFTKQYDDWLRKLKTAPEEDRKLLEFKIELVIRTARDARDASSDIAMWILRAVTVGISYITLANYNIPCSKVAFYKARKKYFELLNERKNFI